MPPTFLVVVGLLLLIVCLPAAAEEPAAADPVEKALASPQATGLLITGVGPETQADVLGMKPGDVIVVYDGHPTPSIGALRAAMQAVNTDALDVLVIRLDGSEKAFTLVQGRIGVELTPVVKGKGLEPLPPATDVKFDFSSLAAAPHDDWYDFTLGGEHAGFEHGTNRLANGQLVMRREVAFDGGEQWGVNHFDVTVVLTAEEAPQVVSFSFLNPVTGYSGQGEISQSAAGQPILRYTHTADEGGPSTDEHLVPTDLPAIPSYVVETLACFMPREKGACFHYRSITDATGEIGRPEALWVVGEETITIGDTEVKTVKVQVRTARGGPSTAFWVNEKGRVVKADYKGAVTLAAKKEDCLKDLHHGLQPRTAD